MLLGAGVSGWRGPVGQPGGWLWCRQNAPRSRGPRGSACRTLLVGRVYTARRPGSTARRRTPGNASPGVPPVGPVCSRLRGPGSGLMLPVVGRMLVLTVKDSVPADNHAHLPVRISRPCGPPVPTSKTSWRLHWPAPGPRRPGLKGRTPLESSAFNAPIAASLALCLVEAGFRVVLEPSGSGLVRVQGAEEIELRTFSFVVGKSECAYAGIGIRLLPDGEQLVLLASFTPGEERAEKPGMPRCPNSPTSSLSKLFTTVARLCDPGCSTAPA